MTCNPQWPEIQKELRQDENASHRPDLCARVFHLKMREMMDDILKKQVLGHVLSHLYTVEFQVSILYIRNLHLD